MEEWPPLMQNSKRQENDAWECQDYMLVFQVYEPAVTHLIQLQIT